MRTRPLNKQQKQISGQAILEFTFCMIVILLMLYGLGKVFLWTGRDVAERRVAHDTVLVNAQGAPLDQIKPDFYIPGEIDGVWDGN